MQSRNLVRRKLVLGIATTVATLTGLHMGLAVPSLAQERTTLNIVSTGGVYQEAQTKAFFDPFAKENPDITVRQESPTSNAKLKAMVEAGNVTWDIVAVDDSFGLESDGNWLEPIDYSVVDKEAFLPGYAGKYRIGGDVEATTIVFRKDKFTGAGPSNFADLFDTDKFPGKRTFWKYAPGGVLEAALIADGVTPDHLYPLDVDRALKKLDTIKQDIIWWETGAQSEQFLTSGEASIGLLWVGRALETSKNAPTALNWGQWTSQNGFWVVPKGTKNKDAAMKALKFFASAAPQAEFAKLLPYGPTNKHAEIPADSPFRGNLPTDHLDTRIMIDSAWWNANQAEVDEKFQDWLLQ